MPDHRRIIEGRDKSPIATAERFRRADNEGRSSVDDRPFAGPFNC